MNKSKFPWPFALINIAIIVVIAIWSRIAISPKPLITSIGELVGFAVFVIGFGILGALLLIGLSLAYQGIVYAIFKGVIKRKAIWLLLFLLPATLIAANSIYSSNPRVKARSIVEDGRLAELPNTATGIRVHARGGFFTGEQYLRFQASSEEINEFIFNSPSLVGVEPRLYSKASDRYFSPSQNDPDWFSPDLTDKGRVYV